MGWWDWLSRWWHGRRLIRRDVSGLGVDDVGADAATRIEVIAPEPTPLKPGHRRLTHRDRRLLPKPKPKPYLYAPPKRPRWLSRDEADRLFSDTLRTRDRAIRDLAPDPEQWRRLGLPEWSTEADLATDLGITVKQLRHYSIHRQRDTTAHYVTFAIPKRTGGERLIFAPKRRLKALLRRLHELLVAKLPVSEHAHGFRERRSVASNAAPHVGKQVVIKFDIADCFPTIHVGRVTGLLIAYGYGFAVARTLAVLMTEARRQPVEIDGQIFHVPVGPRVCVQGAPTSPGLCNAVLRRLDFRLAGLARKHGFAYTRYADDLTLSGDDCGKVKLLLGVVGRIAREEGFPLNSKKTRVARAGRRQRVTGVTVNATAGLSRTERRKLRAAIHQGKLTDEADPNERQRLLGKLAYLRMLNPAQAEQLMKRGSD